MTQAPKGLARAELTKSQQELLGSMVSTYTGRVPLVIAPDLPLDEIYLAWAGSIVPGAPHSYRPQGPRFLAEWDNQAPQVSAEPRGHLVHGGPRSRNLGSTAEDAVSGRRLLAPGARTDLQLHWGQVRSDWGDCGPPLDETYHA